MRAADKEREALAQAMRAAMDAYFESPVSQTRSPLQFIAHHLHAAGYTRTPPEQPCPHPPRTDGGEWKDITFAEAAEEAGWSRHSIGSPDIADILDACNAIARRRCADAPAGGEALRDGRLLQQAFAETYSGGGWSDPPAWGDHDDVGKQRWADAENRYRTLFATPQQESPDAQR